MLEEAVPRPSRSPRGPIQTNDWSLREKRTKVIFVSRLEVSAFVVHGPRRVGPRRTTATMRVGHAGPSILVACGLDAPSSTEEKPS